MLNRADSEIEEPQRVEIFLSCRKLKNMDILSLSDPQILVYVEKNENWTLYDKTETIDDDLNPDFAKTVIMDFHFETKQKLKFEIIDIDGVNKWDFIGKVETTLGEIVGAKNQTSIFDIKDGNDINGKLITRCESVKLNNDIIKMNLEGHNLLNVSKWMFGLLGTNNPFLTFYRSREDGAWVKVYQTEVIPKSNNPCFKSIEIKIQKLCNGDLFRPIKVDCHSRGKDFTNKYIGEFEFNINSLLKKNLNELRFQLLNPKNKSNTGIIFFTSLQYIERPTFLNYIRGGVQLNVILAIDFTASNGHPSTPESLHSIKIDGSLNEYQRAIIGVCEILLNYDHDKRIPIYGFGAKPLFTSMHSKTVSHCFPANGDPINPYVFGLDEVMKTYAECIRHVELSGPTLFSPLINETMKIALKNREKGSVEYSILLVLTDGEIHDMEETINCLIKSADLPLSIIIIGIGKADFLKMETLDGDEGLYNSQGIKAARDLVQFVPFRNYEKNHEMLASEVLKEIPDQLVEYMSRMGIKAKAPTEFTKQSVIRVDNSMDDIKMAKQTNYESIREEQMKNETYNNNIYGDERVYNINPVINFFEEAKK